MRMKTLACCRRRPQDFSMDMDQEPDSKQSSLPKISLPCFSLSSCFSSLVFGQILVCS